MKRSLFLFPLFLLISLVAIAQSAGPVTVADLMKIATVNQLTISPDGNRAAGVVTRKMLRGDNDYYYTRHLWLFDLTGKSAHVQLTFGDRNDGTPQWSPDGRHLAFTRVENEKTQVWILAMGGGEASPLTKAEHGAFRPRWSPDGKSILFQSPVPRHAISEPITWIYERPGRTPGDEPNFKAMKPEERKKVTARADGSLEEVRAWLAKNAADGNPRVLNRLDLQGELTLQPDETFTHLYLQPFQSDEKPVLLAGGMRDYNGAEWMTNGKQVICASKKYTVHPDVEEDNDLWTIDATTREARELLHWQGYDIGGPSCSPDGTTILFRARPTGNRHAPPVRLAVIPSSGGTPLLVAPEFDRDAAVTRWSADSKTIYFNAESEGLIPVWSVPAKGGKATLITGADAGINEFDVSGDRMVMTRTVTKSPMEAGLFNLKDKSWRQLTTLNDPWLKDRQISEPKPFRITRPDGTSVQYWVMEPLNRKPGARYPVILNIHGGPSAMWGPGVFSMWHEFQVEAAWGYGIVYCNPRGSGGYGDNFRKGNYQDWGTGPAGDILASLDDALGKHDWMDKDQLFVEGGSYAGYMVAWLIGHDNRFKAANAQRGVYELTTFMGEGNAWRLIPTHFGGYPWSPGIREVLERNSPYTYADRINTPLLIIHGDQDLRTGVSQSEMLYKSLKILNKPVEYVRYPKEGHELTRSGNPGRMMDHLLRIIEFFERYTVHPH